ncbi:diguanylate cyclase/phosphodiesterase [Catenovulum agarivorans DS-2]|uniref:Diguanylate cyclase/phosphodiesterase n=1 Tax=Catenovulum agarivorans DS-2 TaxID=1328313 RepID=W7QKU7_9ALTE|nr:EAL domain-containing protein [Catenovulum agarivorans]EWH08708.1 diguanylate cyclase/phosphodiesterase [Catenovulum agarivorans DS-2]
MNPPAYREIIQIINQAEVSSLLQPIYNLATNSILGYEALIRGPKNSKLHNPFHLFKAADAANMRNQLETLCIEKAIEKFSQLALPGKLFINITPDFAANQFNNTNWLVNLLKQQGVSPNRVVIELTEQTQAENIPLLQSALANLRKFGIQFAIDDLGAGYSGLIQWSELQPDIIKLDRHFVQDCHLKSHKQQFLSALLDLATNTNALTIVEGIESQEELECIYNLGFNFAQGFYLAKPKAAPTLSTPKVMQSLISDAINQLIQQTERSSQRLLN